MLQRKARSRMVSKRTSSAATVASALVGGNDNRDACEPADDDAEEDDDDDDDDSKAADAIDGADADKDGGAWASSICRRRRHADSYAWHSTLSAFVSAQ
jgi:hypothetical protein